MTEPALTLDSEQRRVVEDTIADHCRIRGWHLHAVSCRTQHVHVIVTAPQRDPEQIMDQFKAWCTRRLKELERKRHPAGPAVRQNWWTQRGSKRWLNDNKSFEEAIGYVLEGQGDPTPRPLATDTQA
jgi:REP element-mobilizing transposase RayT